MNPDDKNRLKSARSKLYAKKDNIGDLKRIRLKKKKYLVNSNWEDDKKEVKEEKPKKPKKPMTFYTKFLIFSFSFFLISIITAVFIFGSGANQITYEKVGLGIQGPNFIAGGDTISFIVSVTNQNAVPIVLSDVYVLYPDGTVEPGSPTIPMARDRQSFDKILPGETKEVRFNAVIFGSEGETKKIQVRYEYRIDSSNAIFHKDKDYDIRISTAPVNVSSTHPEDVLSGDEIELDIEVASNSTEDVSNLGLKIDYPFGFVFESAIPEPVSGDNIWDIGTILAAGSKNIKVKGIIGGQDGEERVFRYSVGAKNEEDLDDIGSIFSASESVIAIRRPDFDIKILVNGREEPEILYTTDRVNVEISVTNNLDTKILNPSIGAILKNDIFDPETIEVEEGFFNSLNESIVWSRQTSSDFNEIEKGETKTASFNFLFRNGLTGEVKEPRLLIDVSATGDSFSSSGGERAVISESETAIKLGSDLIVSGQTLYAVGPIGSSGPIPPKVGEITGYTIKWEAFAANNDFTDTVVSATLPPYVQYLGIFSPPGEDISYDDEKKEVVWNIGRLDALTGFDGQDTKEVYFKIALEPSISQVGQPVELLGNKKITGFDTFAETLFITEGDPETTEIDEDGSSNQDAIITE